MKNLVRLPLIIVVVLTLPCTLASGEVYLVPTDFPTIQSAIDFATDNDEIIVGSGVYTGTGAQVIDMSGKALWLHSSDGPEATILDGEGARRGIVCVMGEASDSKIEGFTIQNCRMTDNGGGGMYILESSPTLTNCRFRTNHAFFGGGIFSDHGSPTLEGCKFENNVADGHGGGMNNSDSRPILANCVFEGNSGSEGGGMMNTQTSNPLLINCRISNNNGGGIYNYHQFTTATLAGTVVFGNDS